MAPTRARVIAGLRERLSAELDALGRATAMARDEATSSESRPENQYDTRALEASYLAAGQGERLDALKRLAAWAETLTDRGPERVEPGALVEVGDDRGRRRWLLIAPRGGLELPVDGAVVRVVSAASPLGAGLAGLEAEESAEIDGPEGLTTWTVESVT